MAKTPPYLPTRQNLMMKIRRESEIALAGNSWDKPVDASLATVTASATADASTTAGFTLISSTGVCNTLCAKYTSNGTALVPTTTTRSDASAFAYSGVVEFVTDAPIVSVGFLTSQIDVLVEINGVFVSETPTTRSGSGTQYVIISFGASAGAVKSVRIFAQTPARFIYRAPLYRVWAPATDGVIRAVITGDSYTAGTGPSSLNLTWSNVLGTLMGWRDTRSCGIGGTGYLAPGSGTAWKCRDHISDVTSVTPDVVVFAHGANDAAYAAADITAEAVLNYQAVRAALPDTLILVLGPWALASGPSASIQTTEGAISAAVTQMNDPLIKFIKQTTDPAGSWIFGTGRTGATNGTGNADYYIGGVSGADTSHPNDAGSFYLAKRAAAGIRAAIAAVAY